MTSVFPDAITSEEAFGTLKTISSVVADGIATGGAFGTPTLVPGRIARLGGASSGEVFGAVSVLLPQTLTPETIVPPELVPAPQVLLAVDVYASVSGFTNTEFGTPVVYHDSSVEPAGIYEGGFGEPSVWADPSPVVHPDPVVNTPELGTPTVLTRVLAYPASISDGTIGQPSVVISSAQAVYPVSIGTGEQHGAATVKALRQVAPTPIVTAESLGTPTIKRTVSAATASKVLTITGVLSAPVQGFVELGGTAEDIEVGTFTADFDIEDDSVLIPIEDHSSDPDYVYTGTYPTPYAFRALTLLEVDRGGVHTDYNFLPVDDVIVGELKVTGKVKAVANTSDDSDGYVWKAPGGEGEDLFMWTEENSGPSWGTQGSFSPHTKTIPQYTDNKRAHQRKAVIFRRVPASNLYLDLGDEHEAITILLGIQFADYAKRHNILDAAKMAQQYPYDDKGVNYTYDEQVPQRARIYANSERVVATTSQGNPTAGKHLSVKNDGGYSPRVLFAVMAGKGSVLGWTRGNVMRKNYGSLQDTTFRHLSLGRHQNHIGKDHAMRATLYEIRIYTKALDLEEIKKKAGVIQARYGFTDGWKS